MKATITDGLEYGTDRPCEIGRIVYREGAHEYVVLAFRYTDGDGGEKLPWFLTWAGETRLPVGIEPSLAMIGALVDAEKDSLPKAPDAGKVEAAGIEPACHSLPNSPISSTNAQEAS